MEGKILIDHDGDESAQLTQPLFLIRMVKLLLQP